MVLPSIIRTTTQNLQPFSCHDHIVTGTDVDPIRVQHGLCTIVFAHLQAYNGNNFINFALFLNTS
ncbi:hypothetical protein CHS0354_004371, partial [Potamilus streckersoni]